MDNKSLEMLEFPRIQGNTGRLHLFFRQPRAGRRSDAVSRTTNEYYSVAEADGGSPPAAGYRTGVFPSGRVTDIRDKARLAALEGILDPLSLLEVQQTLAALHELRRYLKSIAADFPLLWNIAEGIVDLHQIEKDIIACLDPAGEVLDTASPALSAIRAAAAGDARADTGTPGRLSSGRRGAAASSRKTSSPSGKAATSSWLKWKTAMISKASSTIFPTPAPRSSWSRRPPWGWATPCGSWSSRKGTR